MISIVTITYNDRDGLMRTAESVRQQTCRDFEWIIIDGASTDGTADILKDTDADIIVSEPDTGVYNAMNKGIARATGDYLLFMNAGDTFYADTTLHDVVTQMGDDVADVVYGNWMDVYSDGRRCMIKPREITLANILDKNICHQAMFMRTEVMKQRGYDERFRLYADWAYCIGMVLRGSVFRYVDVTICCYQRGGLSDKSNDLIAKESRMLREIAFPPHLRTLAADLDELNVMRNTPVLRDAYLLVGKHKIYKKIIHTAVRIAKLISKTKRICCQS